jgi:hypothetical protein
MVKSAKQKTKAKGKGKRGTVKERYSASSNLLFLFEYFLFQFDYVDRSYVYLLLSSLICANYLLLNPSILGTVFHQNIGV